MLHPVPHAQAWHILPWGNGSGAGQTGSQTLHAARRWAAFLPVQAGREGARNRCGSAAALAAVDISAA